MALITCPECGKQISDKASCCIHCGFPLSDYGTNESRNHFLIFCAVGQNRFQAMKLIREYRKSELSDAVRICDSDDERIIFSSQNLSEVQNAKQRFEEIGCAMRIASADDETEVKLKTKPLTCPRCGSTNIATGARGVTFTRGVIGASKTVNRCAKCGYTWEPTR